MNKKDKILITGSSGLLGSALVRYLNSKNYKNLLLINSKNTDLTDLKKVTKLIKKNNPKYIFHCANKVFGTGGNQSNKFQMLNENLIINRINYVEKLNDNNLTLRGIPLGIKDLFCTVDMPTTAGSKILSNFQPTYESFVTKKLLSRGSVFVGKTFPPSPS